MHVGVLSWGMRLYVYWFHFECMTALCKSTHAWSSMVKRCTQAEDLLSATDNEGLIAAAEQITAYIDSLSARVALLWMEVMLMLLLQGLLIQTKYVCNKPYDFRMNL